MDERIVIIGDSLFSTAMAVDLRRNGADVTVFLPGAGPAPVISKRTVQLSGAADVQVVLPLSTDPMIIATADVIIANFVPEEYERVIREIAPGLHEGQFLVVFPSNFLGLAVRKLLKALGISGVTVCEVVSSNVVCDMVAPDTIRIHKYKKELKIAASPAENLSRIIDILNTYLRILVPAVNLIETSLENINAILHPLPILLNLSVLERRGRDFHHFMEGVSPIVSSLLEQMDDERLSLGRALSLELIPTLEHLKNYYGTNKSRTIYQYIHSQECPYDDIKGFDLNSRYILQDIPYLIMPMVSLAGISGLKTPLLDTCISLGSAVTGIDFRSRGLGLEEMDLDELGI